MDKLAQENHSYCPMSEEFERYRKIGLSHWTNQEEMHQWNSDQTSEKHIQICTVSTVNLEKSDLNQLLFISTKGGIRRLLHPVPHGGSGMNTGGARRLKIANYVWAHGMRNVLQPTGGVKRTPSHVTFFSCLCAHVMLCHKTLAQVFVSSSHPRVMRLSDCLPSSTCPTLQLPLCFQADDVEWRELYLTSFHLSQGLALVANLRAELAKNSTLRMHLRVALAAALRSSQRKPGSPSAFWPVVFALLFGENESVQRKV